MTACGQCQGSECSNAMGNSQSSDDRDANVAVNDEESSEIGDGCRNIFEQPMDF